MLSKQQLSWEKPCCWMFSFINTGEGNGRKVGVHVGVVETFSTSMHRVLSVKNMHKTVHRTQFHFSHLFIILNTAACEDPPPPAPAPANSLRQEDTMKWAHVGLLPPSSELLGYCILRLCAKRISVVVVVVFFKLV